MIEASYAEEEMQSKEAKKENLANLDETSLLLEIEDRLGIVEGDGEHAEEPEVSAGKRIVSLVLLAAAGVLAVAGVWKVKHQLDLLQAPFERTFKQPEETGVKNENTEIQLGDKGVIFSESGQILYTVPLSESSLAGAHDYNEEIQTRDGWTYYLPVCSERQPAFQRFTHLCIIRCTGRQSIRKSRSSRRMLIILPSGKMVFISCSMVLCSVSVLMRYLRHSRLEFMRRWNRMRFIFMIRWEESFRRMWMGIICMGTGFLRCPAIGLRLFRRQRESDGISYYLKEQEDGNGQAIFCNKGGTETLFESMGKSIDSFCIVGDWIYYSAWMKGKERSKQYSQLFRISMTEQDAEVEELHKCFPGRIWQLYYSEEGDQLYGNYNPKNWKSSHGVIAVISRSGQMSYLNDEELREREETTGNDRVEFVMMQDGQVYCYWEDCYWEKGEEPVPMWRRVLIIPDKNRVVMED